MTFLQDFLGNESNGRLMAWVCLFFGYTSWLAGIIFPVCQPHAIQGMQTFCYMALAFYGVAKSPEWISSIKGTLQSILESKEKQVVK